MKVEIEISDRQVAMAKAAVWEALTDKTSDRPSLKVKDLVETTFSACETRVNTCNMEAFGRSQEEQDWIDDMAASIVIRLATIELSRIMSGN